MLGSALAFYFFLALYRISKASPSFDPSAYPIDIWQHDVVDPKSEEHSSWHREDLSHLDLSLAPPGWIEETQSNDFGDIERDQEGYEGGEGSTGRVSALVYPWNLAHPGSNKVDIVRRFILAAPRQAPKKRKDELEDDFAFRLQKSWDLYERKKRTELKHLAAFQEQCNGDPDQTAAMYEERLNSAKEKKRVADKIRHTAAREARQARRQGKQSPGVEAMEGSLPIEVDEKERAIEVAKRLYLDSQKKSIIKLKLRKAKEAGVSDQMIAEQMDRWKLETLGDSRAIGAVKTALRKKLQRQPDNAELRMEAERLGMNPDIQTTPRKGVKGKEKWLHGAMVSDQGDDVCDGGDDVALRLST